MKTAAFLVCAVAVIAGAPPVAHAASGDGAYGRLDGDASFAGHVGAATVAGRGAFAADVRLRYVEAVGVGVAFVSGAGLSIPFELRPLFPIRFLKAQESGHGFLDLTLDSVALELGPTFALGLARPGMFVGTALEFPLFGQARGLFVRLSAELRFGPDALAGSGDTPSGVLSLGLGWHEPLRLGLVDARDGRLL